MHLAGEYAYAGRDWVCLESVARSAGVRRVIAKEDGVQGLLGAIEAELVTKKNEEKSDQP